MTPMPTNRADEDNRTHNAHNVDPEMEVGLNGVIGKSISRKINSLVRSRKNTEYLR